jgi:hypothetical protein
MKLSGFGQAEKIDPDYCRLRFIIMASSPAFNHRHTIALLCPLTLALAQVKFGQKTEKLGYATFDSITRFITRVVFLAINR